MNQLETLLKAEIPDYDPTKLEYAVLPNPVKVAQRLARDEGWKVVKVIIRHLANGNDEHLHVVGRPHPPKPKPPPIPVTVKPPLEPPKPSVVEKVKAAIKSNPKSK